MSSAVAMERNSPRRRSKSRGSPRTAQNTTRTKNRLVSTSSNCCISIMYKRRAAKKPVTAAVVPMRLAQVAVSM